MALVLITHDMGVVAETADRVIVQYAGQQVEENTTRELFADPHHPYTAALLAALPERATARRLPAIPGVVPGQFDRPPGCLFAPRCAYAFDACRRAAPGRAAAALGRALCYAPLAAAAGAGARGGAGMSAVLEARALSRDYVVSRGAVPSVTRSVHALDGVSFSLEAGAHAGGGRRIRLGQVDAGAAADADRDADRRRAADRRRGRRDADRARRRRLRQTCRWCSRIPTARSTRASRSARRWRSRCSSTPAMRAARARGGGARDHGQGRPAARILSTAIRTCSPAASASASPSLAR